MKVITLQLTREKWRRIPVNEARMLVARQLGITEHDVRPVGEIQTGIIVQKIFNIKGQEYLFDPTEGTFTPYNPASCL